MSNLVIVTGGSSGLGLALLQSAPFAARRIDISRSGPPEGDGIEHLAVDLAETSEWEGLGHDLGRLIEEEVPERAVLIHAAGTLSPIGFAGEVDSDQYTSNVLLNSAAGQVLGHYFLNAVAGRSGGFDLVMVTSGAANTAYPGWSSYGAGKAALDHWVRTVGIEQPEHGVRVVAIAPGVLDTDMQKQIRETASSDFPAVEKFRQLHQGDALTDPAAAASKFWRILETLDSGEVVDLRDYES
jgi:benzil reductase ((S)-benzoin forming)